MPYRWDRRMAMSPKDAQKKPKLDMPKHTTKVLKCTTLITGTDTLCKTMRGMTSTSRSRVMGNR